MPATSHPVTFLAFQSLLKEPRLCIHAAVAFAYLIQRQTARLIFHRCCAMKPTLKTKCAAWCPPHHAVNGISLTKRKDFQQGRVQSTSNIHLEKNIADENDFHFHLCKWHFRCHISSRTSRMLPTFLKMGKLNSDCVNFCWKVRRFTLF